MVGEIGLDYFFIKDKNNYSKQIKIFDLFLSKSKDKLLSINTKGVEEDVVNMLNKYKNKRVIIHWYSGNYSVLKEMIEKRLYFSVGPEILISEHIKKIVEIIPIEYLLTETDNP